MSSKKWRDDNRAKRQSYVDKWIDNNRDYYNYHRRVYIEKNREKFNARRREVRLQNIEKERIKQRQYYEKNKERLRAQVRHANIKRKSYVIKATPKWANEFFIKEIYHLAQLRSCHLGYKWHVDHIVPLRSKIVCGLHVENNLRVIPGQQNQFKSNRYWQQMP